MDAIKGGQPAIILRDLIATCTLSDNSSSHNDYLPRACITKQSRNVGILRLARGIDGDTLLCAFSSTVTD